tara:strand:+ start:589 stop:2604 length:2016 start_codon:yes stop_codon:yes gene_type:complete
LDLLLLKSIVIVGGGSAGWITAGLLAAEHATKDNQRITITLVESKNIGTIGVGEGTWPTMVGTLKKIGIAETDFLQCCNASFKQASKFKQWVSGEESDQYYHPFSMPQDFDKVNLAPYWLAQKERIPFAQAVSLQATLCDKKLAPKQVESPDYATVENHGYHLDAVKFAALLTQHCTTKLNVKHIVDDVIAVQATDNNDISAVVTKNHGAIAGDLFIDCSGLAALLIDKHYKVPFISKKDILFIDKALAVQVPYSSENAPIESATVSTAQTAGWIWDIGLPTRRGVGYVYSSKYISKDEACAQLKNYLANDVADLEKLTFRELNISPGYREKFWVNNCVAVGMSAGFIEPLEASALVMVELAALMISKHLPASRKAMDVVAKNYNEIFVFRWERIIDFLKLHYVLSKRTDSQFWIDNKKPETIPDTLKDLLTLWQEQAPSNNGYLSPYDLFPAASYQYILYGMGFTSNPNLIDSSSEAFALAKQSLDKVQDRKNSIPQLLPSNRDLLNEIAKIKPKQVIKQNWVQVDLLTSNELAKNFPLFFKKIDSKYECIALLGFEQAENLYALQNDAQLIEQSNILQTSQQHSTQQQMYIEQLVLHNLIEPVQLDITFNNNQSVVVSELFTINQPHLKEITPSEINESLSERTLSLASNLIESLNNIPMLIAMKNKLI